MTHQIRFLTVSTAICALIGFTGKWHWLAELPSHFFIQYWAVSLLATITLIWVGDRFFAMAAVALLAILSSPLASIGFSKADANVVTETPELRLFQMNAGQNPERVIEWLGQHSNEFDVVVLIEATSNFLPGLKKLGNHFPHTIAKLIDSPFGIALLSKQPLDDAKVIYPAGDDFPALTAKLSIKGWTRSIQLYAVHPPPPISKELADYRNRFFGALSFSVAAPNSLPAIVMGDFNSTRWSPWFRDYMHAAKLRDSREGHGIYSTWPAITARYSSLLGIPIDASLHTDDFVVKSIKTGPYLGSDHLPIITTLALQ